MLHKHMFKYERFLPGWMIVWEQTVLLCCWALAVVKICAECRTSSIGFNRTLLFYCPAFHRQLMSNLVLSLLIITPWPDPHFLPIWDCGNFSLPWPALSLSLSPALRHSSNQACFPSSPSSSCTPPLFDGSGRLLKGFLTFLWSAFLFDSATFSFDSLIRLLWADRRWWKRGHFTFSRTQMRQTVHIVEVSGSQRKKSWIAKNRK